jgi:hypothetical protein
VLVVLEGLNEGSQRLYYQKGICCNREALPIPITTRNPVQNLPKSTTAFPALSIKSSGFEHLPHIQLGRGARMYVATTKRGR